MRREREEGMRVLQLEARTARIWPGLASGHFDHQPGFVDSQWRRVATKQARKRRSRAAGTRCFINPLFMRRKTKR